MTVISKRLKNVGRVGGDYFPWPDGSASQIRRARSVSPQPFAPLGMSSGHLLVLACTKIVSRRGNSKCFSEKLSISDDCQNPLDRQSAFIALCGNVRANDPVEELAIGPERAVQASVRSLPVQWVLAGGG